MMTVKFIPETKRTTGGKVVDAELHFSDGPLAGLKLVGFAIWERRAGGHKVTFPARLYNVGGERRSWALLRPTEDTYANDRLRDVILAAYQTYATEAALDA